MTRILISAALEADGEEGNEGNIAHAEARIGIEIEIEIEVETDFPGSCTLLLLIVFFRREWGDELTWP
jgi:hypothetical protein